ncbi:MAG TPA: hypothetical protein VII06_05280 [Chloroflexota bacterium]|jgi:Tfp pilus assembly protein PilF
MGRQAASAAAPAGPSRPAAPEREHLVVGRDDVLHALYTQGQVALGQGDGAAATAALRAVVDEAPNAYPQAHWLLAEAQTAASARWRPAAREFRAMAVRRTGGAAAARAAAWGARARALQDAVERRVPGVRVVRGVAASGLRLAEPWLAAATRRDAFPTWALGLTIAVLIGILALHRGGSVAPTAADALEVAPVPAIEADADVFARCQAANGASDWGMAIRACRILHARAPDYDGLADALLAAYLGRGQQRLGAGDLAGAEKDFQQALVYQPDSDDAQKALQHVTLYQQGDKALTNGDWPTAVAQLGAVYADDPDYLQNLDARSLKGKLFAAWLRWGQSALNADAAPDAAQRCGQALALVPDDPEAQRCLDAAGGPAAGAGGEPPFVPAPPAE